jgi:alpha-mannosidase
MEQRWIVNLCPFLHFDNSRTQTYEHNISIVSWNVKSILDYLETHPEHKFCLDQVTLLDGFNRLFPNYWDALHQRVLEGRIEIVGGTYVMPDFVIPDGESIVRQFLYGTRYFREQLGVDVKTGWAVDSSGHCAQMPQILRQCGIDSYYFWRGMPFDSPTEFIWKGPDGSRVNAVWLSKGYDGAAWLSENLREAFSSLFQIVEETGEQAASNNVFVPVGGELVPPLPHLIDIVNQWNDVFPDMRMTIVTPREFTDKLKAIQAAMPTISGELSSGRFSGVRSGGLSARVKLKQMNRSLETLLYLCELYLATTGDLNRNLDLENLWRILLFNQDHNIIRGALSDEAYLLTERRYVQAIDQAEDILEASLGAAAVGTNAKSDRFSFVVFNPLPWPRTDIVNIPVDVSVLDNPFFEIRDPQGRSVPFQRNDNGSSKGPIDIALVAEDMPSLGHRVYLVAPAEKAPEFESSLRTGDTWVESNDFVLEFDEFNGSLTRVFDKREQVEVLRSPGNYITMESEIGDVYRHSESELSDEASELSSLRFSSEMSLKEGGPVRVVVDIEGEMKGSTRHQRVIVYEGVHRIDLETNLDFKGRNKRVRVNFPLSVYASSATVGAQFGTESRPTTDSEPKGSLDDSKGLFSALDWVDCAGPEYGLCLSASGLHEYEFKDGSLKATLLRSVEHLSYGKDDDVMESKTARETGPHSFRLSLKPHKGSWNDAKVWRFAAEHRLPLIGYPLRNNGGAAAEGQKLEESNLKIEGMDLMLSCYRIGETPDELIVRVFDISGKAGNAELDFFRELERVELIDLCERSIGELSFNGSVVTIAVDAHSIVTLRVKLRV